MRGDGLRGGLGGRHWLCCDLRAREVAVSFLGRKKRVRKESRRRRRTERTLLVSETEREE